MEKRGNDFSLTPHFASLDNKIKLFNIIPRFNINFSALRELSSYQFQPVMGVILLIQPVFLFTFEFAVIF